MLRVLCSRPFPLVNRVGGNAFSTKAAAKVLRKSPQLAKNPNNQIRKTSKYKVFKEIYESVKFTLIGSMTIVGLMCSSGYVIETTKRFVAFEPPGEILTIDVDGQKIDVHVQQAGEGDCTVIMDGNIGESSFVWSKVQLEVANFAKTLSIDRPGLGFSSKGSVPRNCQQIVKEYAEVIKQLKLSGKVIFVGNGSGALNMRLLADYLSHDDQFQCEGLVLIDPLNEYVRERLEAVPCEEVQAELRSGEENSNFLWKVSYIGFVRLITVIQQMRNSQLFTEDALTSFNFFSPTPTNRLTILNEVTALAESESFFKKKFRQSNKVVPSVIILSYFKPSHLLSMSKNPKISKDTFNIVEGIWEDGQREIASLNLSNGSRVIHQEISDPGNLIVQEHSNKVVSSIRAIVDQNSGKNDSFNSLSSDFGVHKAKEKGDIDE